MYCTHTHARTHARMHTGTSTNSSPSSCRAPSCQPTLSTSLQTTLCSRTVPSEEPNSSWTPIHSWRPTAREPGGGGQQAPLLSQHHPLLSPFRMVAIAAANYRQAISKGMAQSEAWDCSTVDWTNAAMVGPLQLLIPPSHCLILSPVPPPLPPPPPPSPGSLLLRGAEGVSRCSTVGLSLSQQPCHHAVALCTVRCVRHCQIHRRLHHSKPHPV